MVVEKKGRKTFSQGLWAPQKNIATARAALAAERATAAYAHRRAAEKTRRDRAQEAYVQSFDEAVMAFLDFAPRYGDLGRELATRVSRHATPVGSGTVARTERISIEQRAEAAVIAWMRHQTTAYDSLAIPRQKGMRREVRRQMAETARSLLNLHRRDAPHSDEACPLCAALASPPQPSPPASAP
jgi:hypothetical protein